MNGRTLLEQRAQDVSYAQVAREISAATGESVSRSTISLVVRGCYDANPERIYALAAHAYGRVLCPFLLEALALSDCADFQTQPMPEDKRAVRHWRACQICEHKRQPIEEPPC